MPYDQNQMLENLDETYFLPFRIVKYEKKLNKYSTSRQLESANIKKRDITFS